MMLHWPSLLAVILVFLGAYGFGFKARTFWIAGFIATVIGGAAILASPNGNVPKHTGHITWNAPARDLGAAFWTASFACFLAACGLRRTHEEDSRVQ
jgi:hypothetical protein